MISLGYVCPSIGENGNGALTVSKHLCVSDPGLVLHYMKKNVDAKGTTYKLDEYMEVTK